ncbi:hypothetical protein [Haloplasma contractile]|uniref:Uncharacterized protein n=1 Tax=Haloplasma contractile SSD-17B TaxID=1033810 RepID=U2FRZ7_9MOLU|nr:hypothetical protein [Haloplasma contractile]ERJ13739.1 hypothetical protein HLPCO_000405 [Haloplasma contractile SSD-17B]
MERKFVRYLMIGIIFFIGLSMGTSFSPTNSAKDVQEKAKEFEDDITNPDTDFEPVNPYENQTGEPIKHNFYTSLAKDGEYLVKKTVEFVFEKSDDLLRIIFDS